jgi:ubiquinone/menaquinone biosynthesis C-methylase UbiE
MSKESQKTKSPFIDMFSGVIGQEYDMLKLICPLATEMSRLVGDKVNQYSKLKTHPLSVIELGGGTGITTLAILLASKNLSILSIDNEPTMQLQAQANLNKWVEQGRLRFSADDALTALKSIESNSVDLVASAYTLHNFQNDYREQVHQQIYRILKNQGQFINGDRYALDDVSVHTSLIQQEVAGYFKVLKGLNKLDVLEHWVIHLFNDESENHVMREAVAIQQLKETGFFAIEIANRMEVNALLTATKTL